jgi:hypothetical protein
MRRRAYSDSDSDVTRLLFPSFGILVYTASQLNHAIGSCAAEKQLFGVYISRGRLFARGQSYSDRVPAKWLPERE